MSRFKHRLRRALVWLHLWIGLTVGLWFVVMGLSGSVMAWHQPMVTWEFARRTPPGEGAVIPPSRAIAAMRAAHPEMKPFELSYFIPPSRMFRPYVFFHVTPNPMFTRFYLIDAHTAEERPSFRIIDTVTGVVEYIHIALMYPARGEFINGVLAVITLPLLLTGVWLWWPASLRQLKVRLSVKRGASPLRLLYDLHNILGVYGLPLLVILTVTTVVLATESVYKKPLTQAAERATGQVTAPPAVKPSGTPQSVDVLMANAAAALPGGTPVFAQAATAPDQPFHATIQVNGGLGLYPNRDVYVDPYSGKVLRVDDEGTAPALVKMVTSSETLHSGTWGGLFSRLLYTLSGLIPLGLYVTGFMRWRRRGRAEKTARVRRTERETAAAR